VQRRLPPKRFWTRFSLVSSMDHRIERTDAQTQAFVVRRSHTEFK
jgi:hypothetical protein